MRVLVTGGAGFIGSHIADAALEQGHEVLVLDDLSSGRRENVPAKAAFAQVDLRDEQKVHETVASFRPELISHQGAQTSVAVSTREPARDAAINVVGGVHLCDAAVAHGVKHVVFASTGGAIYGEVPEGMRAKEGDPERPLSPYACSKLSFEHYLAGYYAKERGLKSTVLRYGNVYGPRQDPHGEAGVVAIFAQRIKAGQPIQINARRALGDSGCVRDYVYVRDVVRANIAALNGQVGASLMNVGAGEPVTTAQIAELLQRELGRQVEVKDGPRREGDLERSVLDPTRFIEALGTPTPLSEGLAETARWFAERA